MCFGSLAARRAVGTVLVQEDVLRGAPGNASLPLCPFPPVVLLPYLQPHAVLQPGSTGSLQLPSSLACQSPRLHPEHLGGGSMSFQGRDRRRDSPRDDGRRG